MSEGPGQGECRGCRIVMRLPTAEVDRLVSEYLSGNPGTVVDAATYERRLAICSDCPDLRYGSTCRHCGCLVAARAKIAEKSCPGIPDRWTVTQDGTGSKERSSRFRMVLRPRI